MCRRLVKMLHKGSGVGTFYDGSKKAIRLVNRGCTNRPFYHVVVAESFREVKDQTIEQVGSWDPMLNEHNEQLVALNFERIQWWLGEGVKISKPAGHLLGLSGLLPIAPLTYMRGWRNRKRAADKAAQEAQEAAAKESSP